jgi:probable addiction module antidote protein/putative addiction module killer protein
MEYNLPSTPDFSAWLAGLRDSKARTRIQARIDRFVVGLFGDVEFLRDGIWEMRVDYGSGHRVYFSRRGQRVVILFGRRRQANAEEGHRAGSRARGVVRELRMVKPKLRAWDSAEYLKTEEDVANYLEAVFEDGDPALIAHALGVIARARGMARVAKKAGLGRESLYKALSRDGNPELATVLKVVKALGLKLKVAA